MAKVALFFLLLLLHLYVGNSVYASNGVEKTNSDWSIITPKECRFSGEFTQKKLLQGLDQALVSTGVFFYDCQLGIIWKSTTPNIESLVLNKTGDSYLVKRLKIQAIQSQQHKFVSQLIMALVSADEAYLSDTFDSSRVAHNKISLTPTNRRLKRAIQSITLTETNLDEISFDLLDQNQQTTSITSKVLVNYPADSQQNSEELCLNVPNLSGIECGLLNDEQD